jgi:UDP-2-acetamido-3-amino-2,3-dideoxy-glucuronate N-acetyltransferase
MSQTDYFVHPSSYVDEGCSIGAGTNIWHFCHIMTGSKIGSHCNLGQNVVVSSKVILGNNVKVQNNVSIYEGVVCEDDVFLGPSMVFTNVINPRSAINRKSEFKSTLVKRGATIGANATIVCGNTIGEFALIGAGTVVTKDVAPYALVIGNPGKQVGWVSEYGHRLDFDKKGRSRCPESAQTYILNDNQLIKLDLTDTVE